MHGQASGHAAQRRQLQVAAGIGKGVVANTAFLEATMPDLQQLLMTAQPLNVGRTPTNQEGDINRGHAAAGP